MGRILRQAVDGGNLSPELAAQLERKWIQIE